jgi:hypothetical protein
MHQLVMDDQGTRVIIDFFATEEAALATLAAIRSIRYESPPMEQHVKYRCFKIGDKRYIDQSATYTVEEVKVNEEALLVGKLTMQEYLVAEDAADQPTPKELPDLSDLC